MEEMNKLTPKQRTFVAEYLVSLNASQAARRAGYSEATAAKHASRILADVNVAAAVAAARAKRAKKLGRSAEDVLKDIQEITAEARAGGDLKTAFKGLELEAKHLGMFKEKLEISGAVELAEAIKEGRARVGVKS